MAKRLSGERGADIVEAALVLPILLTLFLALYSFGRGWDIYQTMTRAAREGVRHAVTTDCATCGTGMDYQSSTTIQNDVVFPALKAAGINTSMVQNYSQGYTWLDSSNTVCGAYISFQLPWQLQIPFIPVTITNIMLKTDVKMRLENQPGVGSPTCP